jgi:hypothetical protein
MATAGARNALAHLLRDHRVTPITARVDVRARDAVDYLLDYYSILEVACLAGTIDDRIFDANFVDTATWILSQPSVRSYYEGFYPLVLPLAFRRRLKKTLALPRESESSIALFSYFLDVTSKIENDENVETLQWFLDDGAWDGYDIDSLIDLTRKPKQFLRCLANPDGGDRLAMAVDGLRTFFGFCSEFDCLLTTCENEPVLQSAFWHYHGYWFAHLRHQLGDRLGAIVDGLSSWGGGPLDNSGNAQTIGETLARLTSNEFDSPLRELIARRERQQTPVQTRQTSRAAAKKSRRKKTRKAAMRLAAKKRS